MISVSLLVLLLTYGIISDHLTAAVIGRHFLFNLPFCLILGLLDWCIIRWIYRRELFGDNTARIAADLLLTTIMSMLYSTTINYALAADGYTVAEVAANSIPIVPLNLIFVSQMELYIYQQRQRKTEKRLDMIEKERALFQFEALKNQINPHFLFNSLNILASLAYQDAEKTNLFAKKLSSVYRYLLATHGRPTVTLDEELRFLDSYLYLEKIRFGDTLHVDITEKAAMRGRQVIPASIQMLVENALKHNTNTVRSPLVIEISIDNEGVTVTNNLQLRSYVASGGTGLSNLQRQYTLYNKRIEIEKSERTFIVRMQYLS